MSSSKKVWDNPKRKHFIDQVEMDIDIPDGDINRGEILFRDICQGCHSVEQDKSLGNDITEIYNTKINSVRCNYFKYPAAQRGHHWTKKRLNEFLKDPESVISGSAMTFDAIKDPYERACIIEYLHYLKIQKQH